jgi:hypothetical protein
MYTLEKRLIEAFSRSLKNTKALAVIASAAKQSIGRAAILWIAASLRSSQ